uniref:Methyltransferase HEMK2 n=1 Tax=Xiphophorus couchianus TaxID=32473 RepID=A0A3B5MHS3_9TELE
MKECKHFHAFARSLYVITVLHDDSKVKPALVMLFVTCSCTDVNPAAAQCTARTACCNRVALQPIITDLVQSLLPQLSGKVDVVLFNPPYVVTPSEEVGSRGVEAAWAGGERGRRVTDRFLPLVPQLLSSKGLFYLVTIAENKPEEIISLMSQFGLEGETRLSTRAGNERLSVLRFHRNQQR